MKCTIIAQSLLAVTALAAPSLISRQLATIQGSITQVQTALTNLGTAVDVCPRSSSHSHSHSSHSY